MTSTSTGNRTGALPVGVYPNSDTSAVGPRRMPETYLDDDLVLRYGNKDKYVPSSGNIPLTFLGTPATGWAVKEYGDNAGRQTILTCTSPVSITVASGAGNLSVGTKVYDFPAVDVAIGGGARIYAPSGVTAAVTPAGTPDVGLGTAIGSGASATLGTTMRNVIVANTLADANGTAFNYGDTISVFVAGTSNPALYLNFADGWAASDTLTIPAGTKIYCNWKPMLDLEQSGYTFA